MAAPHAISAGPVPDGGLRGWTLPGWKRSAGPASQCRAITNKDRSP